MESVPLPGHDAVERRYLEMLPELKRFASLRHRALPFQERQEALAECLAWSWLWLVRAAEKGRLYDPNPRMLSLYARRMWCGGRRFAGSSSTDALAPHAPRAGEIRTASLDAPLTAEKDAPRTLGAILSDTRHPHPDRQVRISMDFRTALKHPRLPRKGRRCFGCLVRDYGPGHVTRIARQMRLSPARICQLKRSLAEALHEIGYGPHAA